MRFWLFVASLVAVGGCASPVPGDGRLVSVEVDPAIADVLIGAGGYHCAGSTCASWSPQPLSVYVGRGLRYWDSVGAQLRLNTEVGNRFPAAVLHVVAGGDDAPAGEAPAAWWSQVDGNIHVTWPMVLSGDDTAYASLFAHEAGHALGLNHVDDTHDSAVDVMSPVGSAEQLGPLDRKQFLERWPARYMPVSN